MTDDQPQDRDITDPGAPADTAAPVHEAGTDPAPGSPHTDTAAAHGAPGVDRGHGTGAEDTAGLGAAVGPAGQELGPDSTAQDGRDAAAHDIAMDWFDTHPELMRVGEHRTVTITDPDSGDTWHFRETAEDDGESSVQRTAHPNPPALGSGRDITQAGASAAEAADEHPDTPGAAAARAPRRAECDRPGRADGRARAADDDAPERPSRDHADDRDPPAGPLAPPPARTPEHVQRARDAVEQVATQRAENNPREGADTADDTAAAVAQARDAVHGGGSDAADGRHDTAGIAPEVTSHDDADTTADVLEW
jgi:hypothetical protein